MRNRNLNTRLYLPTEQPTAQATEFAPIQSLSLEYACCCTKPESGFNVPVLTRDISLSPNPALTSLTHWPVSCVTGRTRRRGRGEVKRGVEAICGWLERFDVLVVGPGSGAGPLGAERP